MKAKGIAIIALALLASGCQGLRAQLQECKAEKGEATIEPLPPVNAYGFLASGTALAGAEIPGAPPATATEQALRLRQVLDQLSATKKQMEEQISELQGTLAVKRQAVLMANRELQLATSKLDTVQQELQQWRNDMHNLHARLRNSERKQIDALEGMVTLVTHVIEKHGTAEPAVADGEPPAPAEDR